MCVCVCECEEKNEERKRKSSADELVTRPSQARSKNYLEYCSILPDKILCVIKQLRDQSEILSFYVMQVTEAEQKKVENF